jgi:hypothetical protein
MVEIESTENVTYLRTQRPGVYDGPSRLPSPVASSESRLQGCAGCRCQEIIHRKGSDMQGERDQDCSSCWQRCLGRKWYLALEIGSCK